MQSPRFSRSASSLWQSTVMQVDPSPSTSPQSPAASVEQAPSMESPAASVDQGTAASPRSPVASVDQGTATSPALPAPSSDQESAISPRSPVASMNRVATTPLRPAMRAASGTSRSDLPRAPPSLTSQSASAASVQQDDLVPEPARTTAATIRVPPKVALAAPAQARAPERPLRPETGPAMAEAIEARGSAAGAKVVTLPLPPVASVRPSASDVRPMPRPRTQIQAATPPTTGPLATCDRYNPFGEALCLNTRQSGQVVRSPQAGAVGSPPVGMGASGAVVISKGSGGGGSVGGPGTEPSSLRRLGLVAPTLSSHRRARVCLIANTDLGDS